MIIKKKIKIECMKYEGTRTNICRQMIKMVQSKMAAIFKMATNSIKNDDILMIIKTMLSSVIDTRCMTVIHLRVNLFKHISDKNCANRNGHHF